MQFQPARIPQPSALNPCSLGFPSQVSRTTPCSPVPPTSSAAPRHTRSEARALYRTPKALTCYSVLTGQECKRAPLPEDPAGHLLSTGGGCPGSFSVGFSAASWATSRLGRGDCLLLLPLGRDGTQQPAHAKHSHLLCTRLGSGVWEFTGRVSFNPHS